MDFNCDVNDGKLIKTLRANSNLRESKRLVEGNAAANNSMDTRAKQRLCYQTGLFPSELRVFGFALRYLTR